MLVAEPGELVDAVKALRVRRVAEAEHEVYLVISYPRAYLLGALLVVQVQGYGQTGGLADEFAGRGCGADVVLRENAAVGDAELDHQFLLSVVGQQRNIHVLSPSRSSGVLPEAVRSLKCLRC